MKFKKTTTMILAAAVLLSASLTACSNVETDEAAAESSAAETSAAESSIETTTAETETEATTPESSSESSETDTDPGKFIYDIRDATETGSVYMRVYFYLGDELQGMTLASADEGEDSIPFTFLPSELYTYTAPEDLEEFKLECYLGYSDLEPDDAVLHAYSSDDVDEVYVGTIENAPAPGDKYNCDIVVDPSSETGYSIVIE